MQPIALRGVRCVNEKRKHLIGCFDDWLFRSTIPIGWRCVWMETGFYAMFFIA